MYYCIVIFFLSSEFVRICANLITLTARQKQMTEIHIYY